MGSSWGRNQCLRRDPEEWPTFLEENVMAGDDKPRASRAAPRAGPAGGTARQRAKGSPPERPFDMWLQKQLHAMYDEIASEPLPGDLLNLIDRDAAKSGDGEEAVGKHPPGGGKKAG